MTELPLRLLQQTILVDKLEQQDRITAVFSENAGWVFGGTEERSAPKEVQVCLTQHEAIKYRPPDPGGRSCHEFPAMIDHLLTKLALSSPRSAKSDGVTPLSKPMGTSRDSAQKQLALANEPLAKRDEELKQRDLEIEALRAQICRHRVLTNSAAATKWSDGAIAGEDDAAAVPNLPPHSYVLHRSVSANFNVSEGIPPSPGTLSRASSAGSWRSVDTIGEPLSSPPLDRSISVAGSPRDI